MNVPCHRLFLFDVAKVRIKIELTKRFSNYFQKKCVLLISVNYFSFLGVF